MPNHTHNIEFMDAETIAAERADLARLRAALAHLKATAADVSAKTEMGEAYRDLVIYVDDSIDQIEADILGAVALWLDEITQARDHDSDDDLPAYLRALQRQNSGVEFARGL
jgi:hypothetical protein